LFEIVFIDRSAFITINYLILQQQHIQNLNYKQPDFRQWRPLKRIAVFKLASLKFKNKKRGIVNLLGLTHWWIIFGWYVDINCSEKLPSIFEVDTLLSTRLKNFWLDTVLGILREFL